MMEIEATIRNKAVGGIENFIWNGWISSEHLAHHQVDYVYLFWNSATGHQEGIRMGSVLWKSIEMETENIREISTILLLSITWINYPYQKFHWLPWIIRIWSIGEKKSVPIR